MTINSDKVVRSVTRYEPGPLPQNQEDLGIYVNNELKRLGDVLFNQATFILERTNTVPARPRAGDIRYFDGTNADPLGSGVEGLYLFRKGDPGAWVNLLALDAGTVEISGTSGDLVLEVDNNVANSANLKIRCDAGSPRADFHVDDQVHITLNGQRVGILDTSPSYTLDVFGDGRFVQQLTVDAGIACADTVVSRPRFTDYSETVSAVGTKTAAFNIDLEDGNVQTLTMSGGGTFNIGIINALSSHSNSVTVLGTNLGSCTATFYAGAHGGGGNKVYWADGDDTSDNLMTSSGTDVITFTTFDGGTKFYGFVAGKGMTNS